MNSAQVNYAITEKEVLAIVFATEKFCPYFMGAKVTVHTDHVALHYLMSKKESKVRLMIWLFLLQKFDIDIQDKNESENQAADHLSRLEKEGRPHDGLKINDTIPDEQLLTLPIKELVYQLTTLFVHTQIMVRLRGRGESSKERGELGKGRGRGSMHSSAQRAIITKPTADCGKGSSLSESSSYAPYKEASKGNFVFFT
uniref:Uncharacterized protein LOC104218693 n=1 Tax=Nicotiana sylvestris TaxID=4096 RepID=A0A1U7VHJ4_NICSY|nr:PREDICTED: uncharacterized protein LOC104218693 [Nicotiana sylvestris]